MEEIPKLKEIVALVLTGIAVGGAIYAIKPKMLLASVAGFLSFVVAYIVTGGNTVGVFVLLGLAVISAIIVGIRKELRNG